MMGAAMTRDKPFNLEEYETLPTGEMRQRKENPDLAARLSKWDVKPTDFIPGFRITYRELDNIASMLRDEGWSGFIGLDEAIEAYIDSTTTDAKSNQLRTELANQAHDTVIEYDRLRAEIKKLRVAINRVVTNEPSITGPRWMFRIGGPDGAAILGAALTLQEANNAL